MEKKQRECKPSDIGLKSYFLGPKSENSTFLLEYLLKCASDHCDWRRTNFFEDGRAISLEDQLSPNFRQNSEGIRKFALKLSRRFQNELPKYSPRYVGHMCSDLSLPAILGHWLTVLYNPNNISRESSYVGLQIENEALYHMMTMLGWKKGIGHFTSGGTIANLEAMLRMRNKFPVTSAPKLLLTSAAHYSWKKALHITGFSESSILEIPLDQYGRLSVASLSKILKGIKKEKTPVLGLVSLFGSTELGSIDDIANINDLLSIYSDLKIWHHVDAAYGGFFASLGADTGNTYLSKQIRALAKVDSITMDPHKLAYIPYSCGAFLCRSPAKYHYSHIQAPYIDFKGNAGAGLQTIEGSRPSTGASAMWLTAKTLGLDPQGLGRVLQRQLELKMKLQKEMIKKIDGIFFPPGLDLNILCWTIFSGKKQLSAANRLVKKIYTRLPLQKSKFFVAKTSISFKGNPKLKDILEKTVQVQVDDSHCCFVRMTLMNPFLMSRESQVDYHKDLIESILYIAGKK